MSTLDVARAELGLAVLYLNKAEARDKICRAIQYGSKYLSNREPGTAQNVDKSTSLARKVFRLFKFVNDLHALISPTSPGTPLPLVLLGKDRISLYCWMEPNIRNLPRPEEPTESSNVGRVFGNRVGASSSWMPSLTRISSAKYGSEVQDTQNALQIYQCHEVRIGGVLQYRIALCISLKPWMFTCGSVLTLVPKSIRALLYMMQCKCGRAHWKYDIRPTCSFPGRYFWRNCRHFNCRAIGALLKQCAKMVCKGLETDDNNDVLCGRGGSCSTSELNSSERSNDMFCDDIFGESPAGVRKTVVSDSGSSVQRRSMMRNLAVGLVTILLVVAQLPSGLTLPSTVPAFLWSSHQDGRMKEAVNYQTLSSKELANSVMSEGGWSSLLCSGNEAQQPLDLALLFVGGELQSSDIFGAKHADSELVDFLKNEEVMESMLISEFTETCGHNFGASKVAFLESCSLEGGNYEKLADLHTVNDYLVSRMDNRPKGQADLVVACQGSSHSERQIFSELINSVEQSGARYTVLYVSDPVRSIQYPSFRELERFLGESSPGNESVDSRVCDGVCQIKSSLLEGLLVGIVLLIILISGLCCMMGIDTPTRFETPQDS
ncbi:unnamed protein product [Camellia sinensis]